MNNDRASEIISNDDTENAIAQNEPPETVLPTQPISDINPESDNSFYLKKMAIACTTIVFGLAVFFLFAKETDVCFLSTCSNYSDSVTTGSDLTASVGNEFLITAGSVGLAAVLAGTSMIPVIPAAVVGAAIWFLVHLVR